jgi:transcriptional regulator with XRE-family HTH domain
MRNSAGHYGGDLGRRITERRELVGLSRAEAAAGAGMALDYLEYLETSPAPDPTRDALIRLARTLRTTVSALNGAGLSRPPGQRDHAGGQLPEDLDAAQCRGYLAPGGIGRFVYLSARGPAAVPVNFRMLGDDIVFRTGRETSLVEGARQPQVSFEVDHIDDALSEGWSVLVSGSASLVTAPDELETIAALGITPWAGGGRNAYIRISARVITGRRIRS